MRVLNHFSPLKWCRSLPRLMSFIDSRLFESSLGDGVKHKQWPMQNSPQSGHVYFIGAGSGDVELLTLKAARLISQAEAIVYDRLVGDDVLALIPIGCERYYVGKSRGNHSVPQPEIGALMVKLASEGKTVVRLKGGDPGVFGRMGEELEALAAAKLSATIVPGITAASSAAACMGIPLTDRGHAQQIRFVTAQLCREEGTPDWSTLARRDETLVFYMGLSKVEAICLGLREAGLPNHWPIMLIANASRPNQQSLVGTLMDMPQALSAQPLPSPCIIVVGSVVGLVAESPAANNNIRALLMAASG
ncbi:uroporphyrinogen-III C-methyltransferase [Vreelandella aquamarina]|uniref:uroporphyrinogen-III C-methyltransferase n=1 Tax=Vreelandella aquamarina TaxID=77097 RepID=UPI00384F2138